MGSVFDLTEDTKDTEETALTCFDKLVVQGVINYGPSFPSYCNVNGFQVRHRSLCQPAEDV